MSDMTKFNKKQDELGKTHKLMAATCAFVLEDADDAFYKARGLSDAFVASLFLSLGREDAQKIIDGMSEQLSMFKET